MAHTVALVAFDGFQLLDVAGPAAVYGLANELLGKVAYRSVVVASQTQCVRSSCGLCVEAVLPSQLRAHRVASAFVAGGSEPGLRTCVADTALKKWMTAVARSATRYGSVCSGSVYWRLGGY